MRKVIAMLALMLFATVATHAITFTLTHHQVPFQKTINVIEDGGPMYPGAAFYQYTYSLPGQNGNPGIQITSNWILVGGGVTISIPTNATFVDIRVQRFHLMTGAPVGPLYVF